MHLRRYDLHGQQVGGKTTRRDSGWLISSFSFLIATLVTREANHPVLDYCGNAAAAAAAAAAALGVDCL
jgi:hypothetical protein